ncbi:NAD-dependent epimerase/dehydratase family protein [Jiangella rhizosphaerae]|uniref:NAD-dependent epimerase/dehydratase family protein n=1 Tax=Jiangella rhizosphaerae TaxID=2293569 RepID=A0A418KXU1_9ACTN|nr:NAD-dependent epimerase/dehydratase family protein [Jiangella rhizosphaerae]RIQ37432.1 NAD-dependent epimerase/dehydratase family protein [Jiangella rhizosphaerae]
MVGNGAGQPHAVVTGGAGFLGSHLCDALIASGYRVTCVDNFETGRAANLRHLEGDPRFTLLRRDLKDYGDADLAGPVDVVYHLAAPAAPADYLLDPVATMRIASTGTLNALDLARSRSARFVLASTSEVYGPAGEAPSREDSVGQVDPADGYGAYYEARRFAEALTTAYRATYDLRTAIARIFNTYGPRMRLDDGRVLSRFIRQALAGTPLTVPGPGTQTRSLCYVDDAVAGLLALADGGYPGPVNIGSPEAVSVFSIAQEVAEIAGPAAEIVFVEPPVTDSQARLPDISLATQLLDWQPRTSVHDGLTATLTWFQRVGARRG